MPKTPPPDLRELARRRLERLSQERQEEESEEIKGLRAAGYAVLGGPGGYVILPPEQD
jgi:hypothetical protein